METRPKIRVLKKNLLNVKKFKKKLKKIWKNLEKIFEKFRKNLEKKIRKNMGKILKIYQCKKNFNNRGSNCS